MIDLTKAKAIQELYNEGISKARIGRIYGISRERVRQILNNLEAIKRETTK